MKISKRTRVIAGIAGVSLLSFAGGALAVDPSTFTEVIAGSPNVGGQTDATQYGWGDPAKGEKASLVVERTKQRPGVSDDDGPAMVVRNIQNGQGFGQLIESGNTTGLIVSNSANAVGLNSPLMMCRS